MFGLSSQDFFRCELKESLPSLADGSVVEPGPNKRAFGPVTELVRLGDYKIDYSKVNPPELHRLWVTKKKQNTNSFFNLLRYHLFIKGLTFII